MFKELRGSNKKEIPTGTIAFEKLDYNEESFLTGYSKFDIKLDGKPVLLKTFIH